MKFQFNTEKEYLTPVCKVYSVNLEGVMTTTSGDEVPPTPEDDWGTF